MRFRFLFLLLPVLVLSCGKEPSPVRLDFVGTSRFTSSSRTVGPGDTLSTRAYAEARDQKDARLTRLRITVFDEPTRLPIAYPTPISAFNPASVPTDPPLVYLDSVLAERPGGPSGVSKFLFQHTFSARTTSGTQRWEYTVSDRDGQTATRAYRLTVRRSDSLQAVHSYNVVLRPTAPGAGARVFLGLQSGLLLPRFSVNSLPANQALVDVAFVRSGTGVVLASLTSPAVVLPASRWPARRATQLRRTSLSNTAFGATTTPASLASAFASGQRFDADELATSPLAAENVVAFETSEGKFGLLRVASLTTVGGQPVLTCNVRVQK
jgi:hypothetical protein